MLAFLVGIPFGVSRLMSLLVHICYGYRVVSLMQIFAGRPNRQQTATPVFSGDDAPSSRDDGLYPAATACLPRRRSVVQGRLSASRDDGFSLATTARRLGTTVCIPGRRSVAQGRRSISGGDGASSRDDDPPPEATVFLW